MGNSSRSLSPKVIIVESDKENWNKEGKLTGCVDFLTKELIYSILDMEEQPADILEKCRAMDADYVYNETPEIKTPKDIEDLLWAAGDFHDGYIDKEELREDGTLYLLFKETWGCEVEIWLWGDLEYDTTSLHDEYDLPFWFDCTLLLQDGFVWFACGERLTPEEMTTGYSCFKARHMKYRIIPL